MDCCSCSLLLYQHLTLVAAHTQRGPKSAPRTPRGQSNTKVKTQNIRFGTQGLLQPSRPKRRPKSIDNNDRKQDVCKTCFLGVWYVVFCCLFLLRILNKTWMWSQKRLPGGHFCVVVKNKSVFLGSRLFLKNGCSLAEGLCTKRRNHGNGLSECMQNRRPASTDNNAVSYTHLTLPTIYSV